MAVTAITLTKIANEPIKFIANKKERVIQIAFTSDGATQSFTVTDSTNGNVKDVSQITNVERIDVVEMPHETTTPTPTDIIRIWHDVSSGVPGTIYMGATGTNAKVYTGKLKVIGF